MSEYQFVKEEIQQIDQLLAENYTFKSINENLEGAFVTFINVENNEERLLHIKMADSRKYFSYKLQEQLNE
ncbi:hypothetical protein DCE79_15080 [Lysinibacillus sp. 2017]|uniref:hypothetical protein n=1 Tax=unclassified Lysinibacillus TaxID=2636778 RepID=UPI000D52807C|nr:MULTISPECIES: hypothetical protein [unclassified Lysinibacillus]AWE08610.1 hypothetical protein DCE79_15080 [Lysinibacillus sp. 2017]TGN35699.1 hypothetical protein E4L99_08895 [Lysinibacillus sp. S2017]